MLIGPINVWSGGTMPETGNSPNPDNGAPLLLWNGYVPEYTLASNYTITTIFSVSHNTPDNPKEVHVPDIPVTPPVAGIPGIKPAEMGCHDVPCLPFESGEFIQDSDWKRALCIPVSPSQIPVESKGIFRRIIDPVKSGSLTSVLSERTDRNLPKIREPADTFTGKQMELPRGKFRALKRNTGLLFLIRDLRKEAFNGYCKIQSAEMIMILVFGKGTILLAACNDFAGDLALDEICSHKYSWVDAMLHDLNDAQLQLALEFNPSWRVTTDPESLSEEPENARALPALHQMEKGVELRDLHPESHGQDTEENGFDPMENADVKPEPVPTGGSSSYLQEEEDPDWKRALTMEIPSGSNGREILLEFPVEIVTGALTDLPEKTLTPSLKFEPISSDSNLFERRALDLQPARNAAPEHKELWRSMRMNRLQNNSV